MFLLWIALKSWYLWYSNNRGGVLRRPVLWIALKSWYLWYSEQPLNWFYSLGRLWIALKVDIFDIRNNYHETCVRFFVVNCSQVDIWYSNNSFAKTVSERGLWIALKSWYLWWSNTITDKLTSQLLWIARSWYLWYSNNCKTSGLFEGSVVNCSQSWYLWYSNNPVGCGKCIECVRIALKSWYLWYPEQHWLNERKDSTVVNCSQVDIFDIEQQDMNT